MAAHYVSDPSPEPPPRELIRLTVAICISALIHLGLSGEVVLPAPGLSTVRGPAVISARLEIPMTPPTVPSPDQDGANYVHEAGTVTRPRLRPATDPPRKSAEDQPPLLQESQNAYVPASALPVVSDPVYYLAHQLDVYPALAQPVPLAFPADAASERAGGRVLLMLLIDESGSVRELSVIDAGPAQIFERLIRAAFSQARFSPARKDGHAVKSRVLIAVDYSR